MKAIVCVVLCLAVLFSVVNCQWGSNNYGLGYYGGSGTNYGTYYSPYYNYAQNTQAYSNQLAATSYTPYASYGSYYTSPYYNNYGYNSYASPFFGGWGGYGFPYGGFGRWC